MDFYSLWFPSQRSLRLPSLLHPLTKLTFQSNSSLSKASRASTPSSGRKKNGIFVWDLTFFGTWCTDPRFGCPNLLRVGGGSMAGWMDWWIDGSMDRWIDGLMDRWFDGSIFYPVNVKSKWKIVRILWTRGVAEPECIPVVNIKILRGFLCLEILVPN